MKDVGVMKDEEVRFKEIEVSHTPVESDNFFVYYESIKRELTNLFF